MKKILSKSAIRLLIFGIGVIFLSVAIFVGSVKFYAYFENKKTAQGEEMLTKAINAAYEKQKDSDVGGLTPYDTLYRYTEFLQINADNLASTYFVKEKRPQELHRMDGVSYQKRWDYIWLLKDDQTILQSKKISSSTLSVTIKNPLPLVMKKNSNGVWQIESIDYSF